MTLPPLPLAHYEVMSAPSLSPEQLAAIVDAHGLVLDGPIEKMAATGVVHSLWAFGTQWVLRVPKDETMSLGDHRCESVAIPIARSAGVRTPSVVVFDDSLSILDVPFTVVERVHGVDLSQLPAGDQAFEAVGRQLATLHSADLTTHDHAWLRDNTAAPQVSFDDVLAAGLLNQGSVDWLRRLCYSLDEVIAAGPGSPTVFVHGDVKPDNVMLDASAQTQLIDWGDAGFGDPATDFHSLPMRSAEAALRGYRQTRTEDPTLEARVVRSVIARALENLRRSPQTGPTWYRPIAAYLTDLLTFAVDEPERWREWTQPR